MPELEDISDWDGDEADDPEAGSHRIDAPPNANCGAAGDGGHPTIRTDSNHASCSPGPKGHGPTDIARTVSVCNDTWASDALQTHGTGDCMVPTDIERTVSVCDAQL
eukprot:7105332-Lingulodinium_polyedra.AAC.1